MIHVRRDQTFAGRLRQWLLTDVACRVTRAFQSFPGRWRIVRFLKRMKDDIARGRPRPIRIWTGQEMTVDPRDWVGRHLLICGDYETTTTFLFRRILRPGDTVLDVGANLGYFSLVASQLVGPRGRVCAFEASASIHAQTRRNLERNRCGNVTLHNKAVSTRPGRLVFHTGPPEHLGVSSLRDVEGGSEQVVEAIALDDMLEELAPVRLVKIDVEGAEHDVLNGMVSLIERDGPAIILELTDAYLREMGSSAAQVVSFLTAREYDLYRIDWDAVRAYRPPPRGQFNLLCIRRGRDL